MSNHDQDDVEELVKGESSSLVPPRIHVDAAVVVAKAVSRTRNHLVATIIGAGLLSQPGACRLAGAPVFLWTSVFFGVVCHTTACYLVRVACHVRGTSTYAEVARQVYGPKGEKFVQGGLVFHLFGICVGYILIIGDLISPLFPSLGKGTLRHGVLWLVMFPIVSGVRNLASLGPVSLLAVVSIGCFALATIANALLEGVQGELSPPPLAPSSFGALLRATPLVMYMYDMHFNALPTHEDMREEVESAGAESSEEFARASMGAFVVSVSLCACSGLAGYISFRDTTELNILDNFDGDTSSPLSQVIHFLRILFGFGLGLAFPLQVWELREVLLVVFGFTSLDHAQYLYVTGSIFAFVSLWVAWMGEAPVLFGLVGSTVAPVLDFVLPAVLYLKSGAAERHGETLRPWLIAIGGGVLIVLCFSKWAEDQLSASSSEAGLGSE